MENNPKILRVTNQTDELTRLEGFLEELGEEWSIPMQVVLSLNLALEEALTNIISYGYDDKNEHFIEICVYKIDGGIRIKLIDDGHEYDPTSKADPDITLAADDRPIGGLGIFLIRKIMDKVEYQRIDNKNHFTLTKNILS
jgi:serine/threonine-protein kinase RsbW